MQTKFCKKSVFCILFFILFSLGTFSGNLLTYFFYSGGGGAELEWKALYTPDIIRDSMVAVRSLLILVAVGQLPAHRKLLPACVVVRSCIFSYTVCCAYLSGLPMLPLMCKGILLFAVYFAVWHFYMLQ